MADCVNHAHHNIGAPIGLRRMRQNQHVRDLAREFWLSPKQFIQPLFVVDGIKEREVVPGLDGTYRDTPDSLLKQIESDLKNGVSKFLLFGVPAEKREDNFNYDFVTQQIQAIKKRFGHDVWLTMDVCLCSNTSYGHCGLINDEGDHILNEESSQELARQAVEYAQAGVDSVAPSDMMDGRVGLIRESLAKAKLDRTVLMSYAAKFRSQFYGPFRVAADCAPKSGNRVQLNDRATYQLDAARYQDALACAERDDMEGADILMVKPGTPYLDIIARLSAAIPKPWAVYQVSGECAGINLAAREGLINRKAAYVELWTGFKRAGADIIISYGARDAAQWLAELQG